MSKSTAYHTENTQPFLIQTGSASGGSNIGLYVFLSVLTIGAYWVGKNYLETLRLAKANGQVGTDNSYNTASQIHSENRAGWTEGSVQVGLYRQISDYKATQAAYREISKGKDMLEDTRQHVSSGTYQQILNILGLKDGAIKATSTEAEQIKNQLMQVNWVVARSDVRVRKSPKVDSAVFTTRPNILGVARGGQTIGLIDKPALIRNKGKLFYDDKNSTFFLPVLIFDSSDLRKYYSGFVSIANVNLFKDQPNSSNRFLISSSTYLSTYAT